MKINIDVQSGQLIAENIQAEQANKVIEGFFGLLGAKPFDIITITQPTETKNASVTEKTEKTAVLKPTNKKQTAQNTPKILPKVNGDWSLSVPIGEILESKQEDVPEHWKTGIFYNNDGEPRYRTKYWCDCGNQGKRYVEKDTEYIHCHECNQKLLVEPATLETDEDGLPERDGWGNFYIAREALVNEGE